MTRPELNSALRRFRSGVSGGDEVVFFHAGRSVQLNGANFLLPVDAMADDPEGIEDGASRLPSGIPTSDTASPARCVRSDGSLQVRRWGEGWS